MKKLLILLIIILVLTIGTAFWWQSNIAAVNPNDTTQKIFIIHPGEGIREVGYNLKSTGLVKNPVVFFVLVKLEHFDEKIQAGNFRLSQSMDLPTVMQKLTHGSIDLSITIPEGKRAFEIAEVLKKQDQQYNDSWKTTLAANEGYLFPDTYRIPANATIEQIVAIMRKNFANKYTLVNAVASASSQDQIVTVASLVEREAKFTEDRSIVASIIYNRLNANMPLQLDATIQYALGYDQRQKTWWKNNLTQDDLAIKSPYNTYLNTGLPPTPISNPGLSALDAAIHPATTQYLYYISDSQGRIHPAKTLEEHNANIQKYLVR